ncbi:DUF4225 domain-containing protein [Pseudomonas sp. LJDD11]|uniref:DUF4225 domain-containing protein n=1 Tax=Pseudomonas sp. LJDD11 TaxID=2931984 RepID=UPI00211C255E|nr:DUF4225 domain-containing protein [Pseudomonas sp. LJDD11]MCQ9425019.1 DUF4225 domain-containing protein [Pseudomonas sp. LJDD11]
MRTLEAGSQTSGQNLEDVRQAAALLKGQACTVAARTISDGILRLQFNRDIAYFAQGIVSDVERGLKTAEQGLAAIKEESNWFSHPAMIKIENSLGLVGGVGQVAAGVGLCYASGGFLCVTGGAALISHGANNIYESSRNLIKGRSDSEGWVRQAYQEAAQAAGGTKTDGNVAYLVTDLTLSGWGLTRKVVSPEARKLFRYIDEDFVRGFKAMTKQALRTEISVNVITFKNLTLEILKDDE